MKLGKTDFDWAVSQGLVTSEQASALWVAFGQRTEGNAKFDFIHLAYYAGSVIVILAMGWLLARNWDSFGAGGILLVSAIYAICFWLTGLHMWKKPELKIPGGLLASLAVCMVPVMTYAVQGLFHVWTEPVIDFSLSSSTNRFNWLVVHSSTIIAALFALRVIRFPFLTAPIAWSLWMIAVDTGDWFGLHNTNSHALTSILYGLCMLLVAYGIDLRRINHRDFAFWLYLFGTFSLYGGLVMISKGELTEFLFALIYVAMMMLSVLLKRKVLMVFGGLGTVTYLFHVSWNMFHDSPLFPLALTALGVSIIGLGVLLQKYRLAIKELIMKVVPTGWQEFLPEN